MNRIARKWVIARAEISDGVDWIAEARAGTGVWVVRELTYEERDAGSLPADSLGRNDSPFALIGAHFDFPDDDHRVGMLTMTPQQRAAIGMSDDVYQRLNIALGLDFAAREGT